MRVFVIPTWHPTPRRPLWCNWVTPHISLLREQGMEARVLQIGLDAEPIPEGTDPWVQPIRKLSEHHLYVPVLLPWKRYHQTWLGYRSLMRRYQSRVDDLYRAAVEEWGEPDILHAHVSLPGGYLAARLGSKHGIPVVVTEHHSGFDASAAQWWGQRIFLKAMGRKVQGFYAVSDGFADRIRRTGAVNVTGVIRNPIDTDLFQSRPTGAVADGFRIVAAGNLGPGKGTDILLEALRLLPRELNWSLRLFGDLARISEYKRWLDDPALAGRVETPGQVPQETLAQAFATSDLYVVASRLDNAQVSMTQALACGTPVVSTRCGGTETLINEQVGRVVPSENPAALSEAMMWMAENLQRYRREDVRAFAMSQFSTAAVAKDVVAAYERAISGMNKRASQSIGARRGARGA